MTLISKRNQLRLFIVATLAYTFACLPATVSAQQAEGVSITVAPTLIELGLAPGEIWQSSVKVINTNDFPLTIYTQPAHFESVGERGQSNIIPKSQVPEDEVVLANWIDIPEPSITIPPNTSRQVAFVVTAPEVAAPGSHFAALQISTAPPDAQTSSGFSTAQVISSLLFVRVAGDVYESALLRSFTASNSYSTEPRTELALRFENTGNVHVRPVGEILIRNMWGAERGSIPVNINTSFGNALPGMIRTYDFSWQREPSLFDIGRYTAAATLTYGSEAKQFVSAKTSFWVIPVKPLLTVIAIVLGIILFIATVSRWYIRRLLRQAGVTSLKSLSESQPTQVKNELIRQSSDLDLKQTTADTPTKSDWLQRIQITFSHAREVCALLYREARALWRLMSPRAHLVAVAGAVVLLLILWLFVRSQAATSNHAYQATIGLDAQAVTYNSEEIAFFQQPGMSADRLQHDASYSVTFINASPQPGLAGERAAALIDQFPITTLATDATIRTNSVVLFPTDLQDEAIALSEALPGALLSAVPTSTTTIVVYLAEE
tara:strand:+ start:2934 stop:4577 length:1644 start_codon:yes stop_codon:yes gene_type:complete